MLIGNCALRSARQDHQVKKDETVLVEEGRISP
jgi:hypothetical protein